jgi:methyl-accepting chemotaxis protein
LSLRNKQLDIANGNFTVQISTKRRDELGRLLASLEKTRASLDDTVSGIITAANEVSTAAAEIATSTSDLSQRTEEQAAGLKETSATLETISETVRKNAENAQRANEFVSGMRKVADDSSNVVGTAVAAMAKIEDSSHKIGDIIVVIDEIARQTNLLALNAAVEAARAGEARRGFAVVAAEVRSRAQRSAQAAKDINGLISSSSGQVKNGVELVNRTGTALNAIVESIRKVSTIVAEIATTAGEQAESIDQVKLALRQLDEVTQQNSALVEENAATAKALDHQSADMSERVAVFKLKHDEGSDEEAEEAAEAAPTKAAPEPAQKPVRPARRAA